MDGKKIKLTLHMDAQGFVVCPILGSADTKSIPICVIAEAVATYGRALFVYMTTVTQISS